MTENRKPIFHNDILIIGQPVWIEVEGYQNVEKTYTGAMAFAIAKVLGWNVETLGDIFSKQREVNYAPRIRFWPGNDAPTAAERASNEWRNDSRCWSPMFSPYITDNMYQKYLETGNLLYEEVRIDSNC